MKHSPPKSLAEKSCGPNVFAGVAGDLSDNSAGLKQIFLVCLTFLIVSSGYSQKLLKITHVKQVAYDSYDNKWNDWPIEWSAYQTGNEPVLSLFMLDNNGYKFQVYVKTAVKEFTFDVTYAGFDTPNNWSRYTDVNGDEVDITGSTMSNLSQFGWPDSTVYIYFWIYSQNIAYEFY